MKICLNNHKSLTVIICRYCPNEGKTPRSIRNQNTHTWVCRTKSAKCWSLAHNSIILRRSWISCGKRSDRGRRVYATHFQHTPGHKWPGAGLRKGVVPKGKNTFESGINLVLAGMKTVLSQTSVTTPDRLCHLKGQSSFQQWLLHSLILSCWSFKQLLTKSFPRNVQKHIWNHRKKCKHLRINPYADDTLLLIFDGYHQSWLESNLE